MAKKKYYKSRDEFLNDNGLDEEEKTDELRVLLESYEIEEMMY